MTLDQSLSTSDITDIAQFHDLKGVSVFITGGGAGIGAALTEGFLRQGAHVAFIQRSDATHFVDHMQQQTGHKPLAFAGDITDTHVLQGAIDTVRDRYGSLDILINNAANDQRHSALELTPEMWDNAQAVNLKSYFFACQRAIQHMIDQEKGGTIINFSSISYVMGSAGFVSYTTANAGITSMTRTLAREFGQNNIRINGVLPGWVLTERQKRLWANPKALENHLARQCIKQHLESSDIVGTVLFLSSKISKMITGQVIAVDGGIATAV